MKILQVHVRHVNPGGSEVMFEALVHALSARGHEVDVLERNNADIHGVAGRLSAAINGIYSFPARREMVELLRRERPDVVHLHNVYALLSPSVVEACRDAGVPVVMSLHDYKLVCPAGQNFRAGATCHRCAGGREYHCVLTNCRGTMVESIAYAARTAVARRAGWFTRGVDRFIACSDFVRHRHIEEGFPAARIEVISNFAEIPARLAPRAGDGRYAAFIGRLSAEKGLETLMQAARLTGIPVHVAGSGSGLGEGLPGNVRLVGHVPREKLAEFLAEASFLIVPSRFEEPFGLVAAEGMGHGLAVIAARTGGLAEVIDEGVTGLLFDSGDATALASAMMQLWKDPALAAVLGAAGREKATKDYDKEVYCTKLESVYESVVRESEVQIPMGA